VKEFSGSSKITAGETSLNTNKTWETIGFHSVYILFSWHTQSSLKSSVTYCIAKEKKSKENKFSFSFQQIWFSLPCSIHIHCVHTAAGMTWRTPLLQWP
jgi:hypothetical protein